MLGPGRTSFWTTLPTADVERELGVPVVPVPQDGYELLDAICGIRLTPEARKPPGKMRNFIGIIRRSAKSLPFAKGGGIREADDGRVFPYRNVSISVKKKPPPGFAGSPLCEGGLERRNTMKPLVAIVGRPNVGKSHAV